MYMTWPSAMNPFSSTLLKISKDFCSWKNKKSLKIIIPLFNPYSFGWDFWSWFVDYGHTLLDCTAVLFLRNTPKYFQFINRLLTCCSTIFCLWYNSIKGKRVLTFEGERTVQDFVQFAEKANRWDMFASPSLCF